MFGAFPQRPGRRAAEPHRSAQEGAEEGPAAMIPVAVTARNEENTIAACLCSLRRAIALAEDRLPLRFKLLAVLDDCTDRTEERARTIPGVEVIHSTGGKLEAQRTVVQRGAEPFIIFSDADIHVEENVLSELCRVLLDHPTVQVAYPTKMPVRPRSRSLLAEALYVYNLRNGFETPRRYFNGKCFAIRDWSAPTLAELQPRLARLPRDNFYQFHRGLRIDDIYLSRLILQRHGPEAIREVAGARIHFRPPESLLGMYRYYKRMRLEIERLDILFPELREVHRRYGRRQFDPAAFACASPRERFLFRTFHTALWLCRSWYRVERAYYRRLARGSCATWDPIPETKVPIAGDSLRPE
jgi:glycosyltransferase involved in cell wall biosynthesis